MEPQSCVDLRAVAALVEVDDAGDAVGDGEVQDDDPWLLLAGGAWLFQYGPTTTLFASWKLPQLPTRSHPPPTRRHQQRHPW